MYRKLLATTALALVVTGGAYAQEMAPADPAMAPADPMMETPAEPEVPEEPLVSAEETGINADGWLATEIIGETIYNSTGDDAEAIGDVNDFVLDQNGEIGAVVVGVGGFLGIGQKSVAINWADLELAQDMDGNNRLVASMTREQLENAAEFDRQEWLASEAEAAADMEAADDAMAPAPAGDAMAPAAPEDDAMAPEAPADDMAAEQDPADDAMAVEDDAAAAEAAPAEDAMAAEEAPAEDAMAAEEAPAEDAMAAEEAPAEDAMAAEEAPAEDAMAAEESPAADADAAMDFDSFDAVATADISADELTGTAVYGSGDEEIGSIGDILLSEDGTVDAVIIDFGGFLGIGTKPVAVDFENLTFLRDENGGLVLRTTLTAEDLEAAPEYNEEAYLSAPEDNSLIVE
ncbi:PRC-barrel domain-containing protein [Pelagibacterium halotolerans]|nr:PRC-barrel domain-containing protein [Pelagibacterium halotolerans]QJR18157.1 PRC-barrel domain-containing protein [Pelagibacterium halotolerans]SDZ82748.1 PRC-barrel domain-containing protein [Pelagibacterium halotolerans]